MKHIIANWKMNLPPNKEVDLAKKIIKIKVDTKKTSACITPGFLSLQNIAQIAKESNFDIGAQNCFWEDSGAYTGEISVEHLKTTGCKYVLIGHSERRNYLGESNTIINKKIHAIIDNELIPVLCVGESIDEKRSGRKDHVVSRQIELGLHNTEIIESQKVLIAYEPIWAIGTGEIASIEDIVYMHKVIYQALINLFPRPIVLKNIHVLYGGSVTASNAQLLLNNDVIDGVLVGGASLKINEFTQIIQTSNSL